MVLHNAIDSLSDLLQIKDDRQLSQSRNEIGGLGAAKDSVADLSSPQRMSFKHQQGSTYELGDDSDDDDAPIWEMDMSDALSSNTASMANDSFADEEGNVYSALSHETHKSIAVCERIYTVPEVFDDIMTNCKRKGQIYNLFSECCGAKESYKRNVFRDSITGQTVTFEDEESLVHLTKDQKMKRMSMAVQLYMNMPTSSKQSFNPSLYKVHLDGEDKTTQQAVIVGNQHDQKFESQYGSIRESATSCRNMKRRVHFSELKRVLKIRKFTANEASNIWYQREDFANFKAEMTLLIRDMEASKELAAIWLDSEESERRRSMESSENLNKDDSKPHKSRAWWHDYDHSRRGLERYASPCQARQILASYKVALHKVFAEQRRQVLLQCFLPCIPINYTNNADRIAEIYHEYTAWSSDLALAAGASDADCVRSNFNNDTRKTREYFILKQVIQNGYRVHKHMPEFMLPKCITPKGFLDERETLLGTHYYDLYKHQMGRDSIIERAKKATGRGTEAQTGEEAREEMSHLLRSDLNGPIAPALAPIFDVKGENGDEGSIASMSPLSSQQGNKRQSLAAKAKNYPFQQ